MFDSTAVSLIPRDAPAVAGYVGGFWPTYPELVKDWPHAHRLSIAISAGEDAECLDIENGDARSQDAPHWYRRQRDRGVPRPVLYASVSQVPAIEHEMTRAGIPRSAYHVWSAHYTGHPHLCARACGLAHPADATQWTDRALGRDLDQSLCSEAFFPAGPANYVPADEARWEREYDQLLAKHHRPVRRRVLRRVMTSRRKLIWRVAQQTGWDILNRAARYRQLLRRTE
ncbi:MAG TPA: hypothetical protein VNY31_08350 [Solirubrobacteraceae bacterium]|nr:hypothetical protein [Solirubrobacteraceae bacterium]